MPAYVVPARRGNFIQIQRSIIRISGKINTLLCALFQVVAHENMTEMRREEIYSMLLQMDKLFGSAFKGETPAFSMYGIYDSNRSIIFPVC